MPKYAQVMLDLAQRVERGEWQVGDAIPPVPDLQKHYGFNRLTILKALSGLARDGYVSVEQGRGTFVRRLQVRVHVGLLFGDDLLQPASTPFASLMARAAQDFFHDHRSELKYYIEHAHLRAEGVLDRDLVSDIDRKLLRGLLTVGSNAPLAMARSAAWQRHPIPWVDISAFNVAAHRIVFDAETMIRMGLDHFRKAGRRRVAALALGSDEVTDHVTPFLRLVRESGLTTRPEWIPTTREQPSEKGGYDGMLRIAAQREQPDALLILDDIVAKGATQAILRQGLRVPQDIEVIAHANKGSGIFYPVAFPKLEFDPVEIMKQAGRLLMALMEEPSLPPETIMIKPRMRAE